MTAREVVSAFIHRTFEQDVAIWNDPVALSVIHDAALETGIDSETVCRTRQRLYELARAEETEQ